MPKQKGQLTPKQALFVQEYLVDLNASGAARRAGFAESVATSHCTLWVSKTKNLCPAKYHHVWDAVQEALKARSEAVSITAQDLLKELHTMVSADMRDAYDQNGNMKPINELPEGIAKMVTGVDVFEERDSEGNFMGYTKKLRFASRLQLVELTGKHIGVQAFKEKVEHQHTVNIGAAIIAARGRKAKV